MIPFAWLVALFLTMYLLERWRAPVGWSLPIAAVFTTVLFEAYILPRLYGFV